MRLGVPATGIDEIRHAVVDGTAFKYISPWRIVCTRRSYHIAAATIAITPFRHDGATVEIGVTGTADKVYCAMYFSVFQICLTFLVISVISVLI